MKKPELGKKKNFSGQAREMFASLPLLLSAISWGEGGLLFLRRGGMHACRLFVCRQLIREVTKQKGRNSDKQGPVSFEPWAIITFSTPVNRSCIQEKRREWRRHATTVLVNAIFFVLFIRQFAKKTFVFAAFACNLFFTDCATKIMYCIFFLKKWGSRTWTVRPLMNRGCRRRQRRRGPGLNRILGEIS